tara:strand:- start:413 stop:856 length:444 start_codon:yes stop_codon:yes gene_type:complete
LFKKFCNVSSSLQFLFFVLSHYAVIKQWDFSAVVFMLASGLFFGIAQAIKNKLGLNPERKNAIVAYILCIFTVTIVEIFYGWNNIDISAANDSSPIQSKQARETAGQGIILVAGFHGYTAQSSLSRDGELNFTYVRFGSKDTYQMSD